MGLCCDQAGAHCAVAGLTLLPGWLRLAGRFLETEMSKAKETSKDQEDTSHLVPVTKDGDTLHVHPDTVAAHARAGWTPED